VSPAAQAQRDFQFYAGHPLLTAEGYAIGTLCVLDQVPRAFRPAEQDFLKQLATLAMRLLDLHLLLAKTATPAPDLLAGMETRLVFSAQRLATLTALAQRATAPAAAAYQLEIDQERQLIGSDLDFTITRAFTQLAEAV